MTEYQVPGCWLVTSEVVTSTSEAVTSTSEAVTSTFEGEPTKHEKALLPAGYMRCSSTRNVLHNLRGQVYMVYFCSVTIQGIRMKLGKDVPLGV